MNKQVEQIRAEIERLNNKYKYLSSVEAKHKTDCYADLLSYIDSLPSDKSEKPIFLSEDLEKEIQRYLATECAGDDDPSVGEIARYFANWQKEQMMKDLPSWRPAPNHSPFPVIHFSEKDGVPWLRYGRHEINVLKLEKLPKEDEK